MLGSWKAGDSGLWGTGGGEGIPLAVTWGRLMEASAGASPLFTLYLDTQLPKSRTFSVAAVTWSACPSLGCVPWAPVQTGSDALKEPSPHCPFSTPSCEVRA